MAAISEAEAFAALINALGNGRDAARSLALLRSDMRWLTVARIFDATKDNAVSLMTRKTNGAILVR